MCRTTDALTQTITSNQLTELAIVRCLRRTASEATATVNVVATENSGMC